MNPHSLKRLGKVHPLLRRKVEAVIIQLAAEGLTVEVVQGLRTAQEQNDLYAQGRTKPGRKVTNAKAWQSNHNYGLAVDLCPFVDGKPDWNASNATWFRIGEAAERQGLEWGGRWAKFRDLPHVQLPGLSIAQCFALSGGGSLEPVWEAVDRINKTVFAVNSPVARFSAERGTQTPIASQKSNLPCKEFEKQAFPVSLPPDFLPSKPASVPAQAKKQAVESVKSGNTLPVSLSTILTVCSSFLQENGKHILWAVAFLILLTVIWYEFKPKQVKGNL